MATLLAVGVTLFVNTPTQAEDWGTVQFTNLGDEPQASGQATLKKVSYYLSWYDADEYWHEYGNGYRGTLTVECKNLTPGATYSTPAGTFKADSRGKGKVSGKVSFIIVYEVSWWGDTIWQCELVGPYEVGVTRVNADGSDTPVLSGFFVPPGD